MLGDLRLHESRAVGLELGKRAFLVSAHEPAVASLTQKMKTSRMNSVDHEELN